MREMVDHATSQGYVLQAVHQGASYLRKHDVTLIVKTDATFQHTHLNQHGGALPRLPHGPRDLPPRFHAWSEAALGSCCRCEGNVRVRTLVFLGRKAPLAGRGWGCPRCALLEDGAVAVVCNRCLATFDADPTSLRFLCRGEPRTDGRVLVAAVPPIPPHAHDPRRHLVCTTVT